MPDKRYDVIIAGASFAGLSVASRLNTNRTLLIDRKEIGTSQTSSCGTFLSVFNKFRSSKVKKSILQVFRQAKLHTANKTFTFDLIDPLCTIDYFKFCNYLKEDINAVFLKAKITGYERNTVKTEKGDYKAGIIVDATGWPAVLANAVQRGFTDKNMLESGIETVVDYQSEFIHFFADPRIIKAGVAWKFPIGNKSRFGVAYYHNKGNLKPVLEKFLARYNLKPNKIYGGIIPFGLRNPVVQDLFLVGDSGGQVLPLTAEGIRKAVINGTYLGGLIELTVNNKMSIKKTREKYRTFILKKKRHYQLLLRAQKMFCKAGSSQINLVSYFLQNRLISKYAMKKYLNY